MHGGSAPQVRTAARRRLLEAADPAAARLVALLASEEPIALRAAIAILDRAGVAPTVEADLDLGDLVTPADSVRASSRVVAAVARGEITPEEAQRLQGILGAHVGLLEVAELAARLEELEERLAAAEARP